MTPEFPAPVQQIFAGVHLHPALDNAFYTIWMQQPLSSDAVQIFACNYLARTSRTATMVALTILGVENIEVRSRIVDNLFSEYGCGKPERSHIRLLEKYLIDLLSRVANRAFSPTDLLQIPPLRSTVQFIEKQRELYSSNSPCRVLGAHLAQEWIAYSMLAKLYEGARQYISHYRSIEDFHAHCEYFHVHIGETEKAHRREAILAAHEMCKTEQDWIDLAFSINCFLDITAGFWNGLADALPCASSK